MKTKNNHMTHKLLSLSLFFTISCMLKCFSLAYYRRIKSSSKLFNALNVNTVKNGSNNIIKNGSNSIISNHNPTVASPHGNDQFYTNSLEFYHVLRNCKDGYIAQHINHALDVLTDAYRLYGPDHLISSYNGGKDADVIMHLLRAVSAKYTHDNIDNNVDGGSSSNHSSRLVYFAIEDEFDEVIQHISFTRQLYHLDIVQYDCGIIQGLKIHVDNMNNKINNSNNNNKNINTNNKDDDDDDTDDDNDNQVDARKRFIPGPAFILGTRKGDPNCGDQQAFTPSSAWMPVSFMRVNPILNW